MKKFIVLLGIVVIGCMTVLTQEEAKNLQQNEYRYEEEVINLETAFEKDEDVNKLIQHLASIKNKENRNYNEQRRNNISVSREGGIVHISLNGVENNTYYEQVEKIERVLGLEGLVNLVYDDAQIEKEKMLLSGIKEEYGSVSRIKYYDKAIVTVNAYKREEEEKGRSAERSVRIEVPSEKLKDTKYASLAEKVLEDSYYVSQLIQGEERDVLVLVNANSLASFGTYSLNDEGEMAFKDLARIRYEVVVGKEKPEEMHMILTSSDIAIMNEVDQAVLLNIGREMGLSQEEIESLKELVNETLEKPSKNRSKSIGQWQYSSKYTTEQSDYDRDIYYLEISLRP